MASRNDKITAYIGAIINPQIDPHLEQIGFCHGVIVFAVPEFGILFRCRANGDRIDLEFGAFFSLLRFMATSLKAVDVREVTVRSSNPEFVASFGPQGNHLSKGTEREAMLREYTKKLNIYVQYVEPLRNRSFLSPVDYPSIPEGTEPVLKPNWRDARKSEIKPIQKGIKL